MKTIDTNLDIATQCQRIVEGEPNLMANLANIAAIIKSEWDCLWAGFYLVDGDELVLGPFQGPVACTRIPKYKGVCGAAWQQKETIIVPDVNQFPGHIACSSLSQSEIVTPVIKNGEVIMVIDIDSEKLNTYHEEHEQTLTKIAELIARIA